MEGLLLAAEYASRAQIEALQAVFALNPEYFVRADPFEPQSAWSILLALLPEVVEPSRYVRLLVDLSSGDLAQTSNDVGKVELPEEVVQSRSNALLRFVKKRCEEMGWTHGPGDIGDPFSKWVKVRLVQIDNACGKLEWMFTLMEHAPSGALNWYNGVCNVVYQLRMHYGDDITLEQFESSSVSSNVTRLLEHTVSAGAGRELHKLVIPYLSYVGDWEPLYRWIVDQQNLALILPAADVPNLVQPVMAALYKNKGTGEKVWDLMEAVCARIEETTTISEATSSDWDLPDEFTYEGLMSSKLTEPSRPAVDLLSTLIKACRVFERATPIHLQTAVRLYFDIEDHQKGALLGLLANYNDSVQRQVDDALELQKTFLKRVPLDWLEYELIRRSLASSQFELVKSKFATHASLVTQALAAFNHFFDSASNGSPSLPSMRNATNAIALVTNTNSPEVRASRMLLTAVHELSNYTLAFKPGVPARPVDIKEYPPLDVIRRVLELNPKAYNDLPSLVKIAQNLTEGTGGSLNTTDDAIDVQIRAMCVQAALVNDQFDAAYNLCVPVLSTLQDSRVAWEACFQVGKYVSPTWDEAPPPRILSKQVSILASTLKICPKENITNVLAAWRRLDKVSEEIDSEDAVSSVPLVSSTNGSASSGSSRRGPRKRDQLSNMLVSGLGWAIGANTS